MSACPICRRPTTPEYRPFCSRRCSDVDLQRWLVGSYAIPAEATEEEESGPRSPDPESED